MKSILTLILTLAATSAFAGIINFECKPETTEGVHKFKAKGVIIVDDFSNAEGLVNIETQKAGEAQSIQVFEQLKVDGFVRHYEAGKLTPSTFDHILLKVDNSYIKKLNIVVNLNVPLVSNAISVDNFLYRSNCAVVEE